MEYLTKQKLEAFAKRFVTYKEDKEGKLNKVPITLEEAAGALNSFFANHKGPTYLKPSFIETRVKILKICLQEKIALQRWTKVRDYLIGRIEPTIIQDGEVEPRLVLRDLLSPDSFLGQCIKLVTLFNLTDNNVQLPYGSSVTIDLRHFPKYLIWPRVIMLQAHTKRGEIIERFIPRSTENFDLAWAKKDLRNKFTVHYSLLTAFANQDSKSYIIRLDEFFEEFKKQYSDIVSSYNLNSLMSPYETLNEKVKLAKNAQQRFFEEFLGVSLKNWRLDKRVFTVLDASKIVKEYCPDVREEIQSISFRTSLLWAPDNDLLNENSLRYELADLYLQRLEPYDRENLLVRNLENLSTFNLKTFRDLIARWEYDKENGKIVWVMERLKAHYYKHRKDPKERDKWLEYVRISRLIQEYKKPMLAYRMYRMTVRHNDKVEAIKVEYLRQKEKAITEGYDVEDPKHLDEIKKKWNLFEAWDLVY